MAERLVFIGGGRAVNGREERGLEVFNEAVGLYGRMQQEGRIEKFDVVLLSPNTSLDGYMSLAGSPQQLAAVREDKEFQRTLMDASLIVEDLCLVEGYANEGIAAQMDMYREAIAAVPQRA
jgi:hypothetical protein